MIEPVLMADQSATIVPGSTVSLNAEQMTPPSNRPMLVRDITFVVFSTFGSTWQNTGLLVQAKINAGRFAVTNGFVPLSLMGPVTDRRAEFISITGQTLSVSYFKWILPKPMYLPPNTQMQFTFQTSPLSFIGVGSGSAIVLASVRGLLLDKQQSTAEVPYVTAFIPTTTQLQSGQQDLANVLDKPLKLHRLLGRIVFQYLVNSNLDDAVGSRGDEGGGDPLVAVARNYQLRLRDSMGTALTIGNTSEYVPFWTLFAPGSYGWPMQRTLDPNEHLIATLSTLPTANKRPMVSMVGHRTERI